MSIVRTGTENDPIWTIREGGDPPRGLSYNEALRWFDDQPSRYSCLWRGHEVGEWRLTPLIFRFKPKGSFSDADAFAKLVKARKEMLTKFRTESVRHGFFSDSEFRVPEEGEDESLDLEMLAQHYGLPTRLLDWSESFHTALFFAFGGWSTIAPVDPCIWCLDRGKLRDGGIKIQERKDFRLGHSAKRLEEDYKKQSDAIQLVQRDSSLNARVRKQRGWFTYQIDARTPVDKYVEDAKCFPGGTLTRILLRVEDQARALKYLEDASTVAGTIRNDLEGVSTDVRNLGFRFEFERL